MHMNDGLLLLEERNLIQRIEREDQVRWRMLATLREFGLECLGDSSEMSTICQRHLEFFANKAKHIAEEWQDRPEKQDLVEMLMADEDNLQAALRWSLAESPAPGDADHTGAIVFGAQLSISLYEYWVFLGRIHEGLKWNRQALTYKDLVPLKTQAGLLSSLGGFIQDTGDYDAARQHYQDSITVARQLGDQLHVSKMLNNMAIIAAIEERLEDAQQLFEQAIATGRDVEG
jgi:tetratricopeptide (TPR) repeat protein